MNKNNNLDKESKKMISDEFLENLSFQAKYFSDLGRPDLAQCLYEHWGLDEEESKEVSAA